MARHEQIDTSPQLIAVDLDRQLLPGTFEHALNYLIEREAARKRSPQGTGKLCLPGVRLPEGMGVCAETVVRDVQ